MPLTDEQESLGSASDRAQLAHYASFRPSSRNFRRGEVRRSSVDTGVGVVLTPHEVVHWLQIQPRRARCHRTFAGASTKRTSFEARLVSALLDVDLARLDHGVHGGPGVAHAQCERDGLTGAQR